MAKPTTDPLAEGKAFCTRMSPDQIARFYEEHGGPLPYSERNLTLDGPDQSLWIIGFLSGLKDRRLVIYSSPSGVGFRCEVGR